MNKFQKEVQYEALFLSMVVVMTAAMLCAATMNARYMGHAERASLTISHDDSDSANCGMDSCTMDDTTCSSEEDCEAHHDDCMGEDGGDMGSCHGYNGGSMGGGMHGMSVFESLWTFFKWFLGMK